MPAALPLTDVSRRTDHVSNALYPVLIDTDCSIHRVNAVLRWRLSRALPAGFIPDHASCRAYALLARCSSTLQGELT